MTKMSLVTSQALGKESGEIRYHPYVSGGMVRRREEFVATEGQTVFNLEYDYTRFQNKIDVVVGGVSQFSPENFIETSSTSFTLTEGVPKDTEVIATYFSYAQPLETDFEEILQRYSTLKVENVSFVNVYDFGVMGDGITDDSVAIQSAINSLENGGVIFFPEGTYLISSSLVINKSNVTLKGLGRKLVEIKDHPSMIAPTPILLITGVNKTNRIENITIEGIKIRNGSATTGNYTSDKDGIKVMFANNITVKHCMITEIQGAVGLMFRYCRNINILNNYMYRCTYAAFYLLEECEDIRVLDNEIDTLTSTTSSNTYAIATGYDMEYGVADFPVKNLWVERNIIRNNPKWEGIDSHGGQNIWIRDNYVENCQIGIMVSSASYQNFKDITTKNIVIENNVLIRGNGDIDHHGLYVGGDRDMFIENLIIKGNEIKGFGYENKGCLVVENTINTVITQNTIDEYRYNGIAITGAINDIKVHNNLIKNKDVSVTVPGVGINAIWIFQNANIGISIENNKSYPDSDAQAPTNVVHARNECNVVAKGNKFRGPSKLYEGRVLAGFEPGVYDLDNISLHYLRKGDIIYDTNEKPLYLVTGPETGHAGNRPLYSKIFSGSAGTNILTTTSSFVVGSYGLGCNITIPLDDGSIFKAIITSWTDYTILLDRNLPENIVNKSVTNDIATWEMITTDSDIASLKTRATNLETYIKPSVTYSFNNLHLKANHYNATQIHIPGMFFKWGTDYQSYVQGLTIESDCLHFTVNRQPSIAVDTKVRKRFIIHKDVIPTFGARIYIKCFDANGNILLESVPDGTIGSLYVQADVTLKVYSNTSSYETATDSDEPIEITVSADVKKIHIAFGLGVSELKLRGFSIESLDGATSVYSEAAEFLEGAKLATMAPTLGTYKSGTFIYNASPSELGTTGSKYIVTGWTCITTGTPGTWVQNRSLTGN